MFQFGLMRRVLPLARTMPGFTQTPSLFLAQRYLSMYAGELRMGDIFIYEGDYVQVMEFKQVKQARSTASTSIEYIVLASQKPGHAKYPGGAKVEKIEPEKVQCSVLYIDKDNGKVVVADENFEQIEVGLNFVKGAEELLEPGVSIAIYKHDDTIIKVGLPSSILGKMRKK